MTDIMKLIEKACSTAAMYELENYYGTSKDYTAMCKVEAEEAQRALQSAIEALQGERDAIEKNAINQVDDLHKAWAERDALQAENERLQTGYLKIRVALGLDLHSTDNLLDVAQALKAELGELQRQEPVAWTLTEELTKRETTTRAHLWFTDPVNCMWSPLYAAPKALEAVAWLKQEWAGTGKKSLHFERQEPTVREEVERPTWRQLYAFDIASEPSGNETL